MALVLIEWQPEKQIRSVLLPSIALSYQPKVRSGYHRGKHHISRALETLSKTSCLVLIVAQPAHDSEVLATLEILPARKNLANANQT